MPKRKLLGTVYVKVIFDNPEAVDAFAAGLELLQEAADDMTWRDDLREAADLMTQAADGIGVTIDGP